jgi:hypothetical protein
MEVSMHKTRFGVPTFFGNTSAAIQRYMVAPIVEFLRLNHRRT